MSDQSGSTAASVGLVGVSGYAAIHLNLLRRAHNEGRARFVAAVIINPEEEQDVIKELAARGARVYSTFDDFLKGEAGRLDLCCVPTGIQWHAPMTVAALEAGMNVLVEKPLAGCLADADRIVEAEQRTGRFVAVGFQDMYVRETVWLKDRLLEGAIGDVHAVRFLGLWPRTNAYYQRNRWAGKVVCDGITVNDSPFNNAFAHFLHLAMFFAGRRREGTSAAVVKKAQLARAHSIESFDTAVVVARAESGVDLWFGASHACREVRDPEILILGSRGQVTWRYEDKCVVEIDVGRREEMIVGTAHDARWDMLKAVLRRLVEPEIFISRATGARKHTALIEAIHNSEAIRAVHASRVQRIASRSEENSEEYTPAIHGLEKALDRSFVEGSTCPLLEKTMKQDAVR